MKFSIVLGFILLFLFSGCGGGEQKEEVKGKTRKAPTKENKELSKENYGKIAGHWRAHKIAETKEDELQLIPGDAMIFLIINKDRTFYTTFNLDTITEGNYTIKEQQVVFNETKNYVGKEVRYLSVKMIFSNDMLELEGEWVEHNGMKEYHHSQFIKDDFDVESIREKLELKK